MGLVRGGWWGGSGEGRRRGLLRYADASGSASNNAYPGVVYILGGRVPCTGVLLRNSTILTAGLCVSATTTNDKGASATAPFNMVAYAGAGTSGVVTKSNANSDGNYIRVGPITGGKYLYNPGVPGRNLALLTYTPTDDSLALPTYLMPFERSPTILPDSFPFDATVVGFGASGGTSDVPSGTGLHRSAVVTIQNQTFVAPAKVWCGEDERGAEYVVEHPTSGVETRLCRSDWGGPLFWDGGVGEVVLGIAGRRDDDPCSDEYSWYQSVAFQQAWIEDQLAEFDLIPPIVCPSATPTPTPSPSPTPSTSHIPPTPTPTPSTSAKFAAVVPREVTGLTDLEIAMIVLAVMIIFGTLCGFLYWYIVLRPVHHKVVATDFGVLDVPTIEAQTRAKEERAEILEKEGGNEAKKDDDDDGDEAEHDGTHAECEMCAFIRADKERKRQRTEALNMVHHADTYKKPSDEGQKVEEVGLGAVVLPDGALGAGEGSDALPHPPPRPTSFRTLERKSTEALLLEIQQEHEAEAERKGEQGGGSVKSGAVPGVVFHYKHPEDVTPLAITHTLPHDLVLMLEDVDRGCVGYFGREVDVNFVREALQVGGWGEAQSGLEKMRAAQEKERIKRRRGRRGEGVLERVASGLRGGK